MLAVKSNRPIEQVAQRTPRVAGFLTRSIFLKN
jgi:hypothetical protein